MKKGTRADRRLDTKQPTIPISRRVNSPGTVDLIRRKDGTYE